MSIFSVFSVMAGWIAEILFMLLFAILLCNGQNIAEYEAYWVMGRHLVLYSTKYKKINIII